MPYIVALVRPEDAPISKTALRHIPAPKKFDGRWASRAAMAHHDTANPDVTTFDIARFTRESAATNYAAAVLYELLDTGGAREVEKILVIDAVDQRIRNSFDVERTLAQRAYIQRMEEHEAGTRAVPVYLVLHTPMDHADIIDAIVRGDLGDMVQFASIGSDAMMNGDSGDYDSPPWWTPEDTDD
jgi:hypothetical protein